MSVRRGYLNKGHIKRQDIPAKQVVDLTEENGNIVSFVVVHSFSDIGADKTTKKVEGIAVWFLHIRCRAIRMNLNDAHIVQFVISFAKGVDQKVRSHCSSLKKDAIARFDY